MGSRWSPCLTLPSSWKSPSCFWNEWCKPLACTHPSLPLALLSRCFNCIKAYPPPQVANWDSYTWMCLRARPSDLLGAYYPCLAFNLEVLWKLSSDPGTSTVCPWESVGTQQVHAASAFTQLAFSECPPAQTPTLPSPPLAISASSSSSDLAARGRQYQYLILALSLLVRSRKLSRILPGSDFDPSHMCSLLTLTQVPRAGMAPMLPLSVQPGWGLFNFSLIKKTPQLLTFTRNKELSASLPKSASHLLPVLFSLWVPSAFQSLLNQPCLPYL